MEIMNKVPITVPGRTLNELIYHWASRPDSSTPAFVSVNPKKRTTCSITRKDVLDYGGRFANKLSQLGITKGTIVCSTIPNSIERLICDIGIYLAGAISMNGQIFRSDGQDFIKALKASQAHCVIVDPRDGKLPYSILKSAGLEIHEGFVKCPALPFLSKVIFCSRNLMDSDKDFLSSLQNSNLQQFSSNVDPSDLAAIMTTSGSTGYSKLVKLSHFNLCHFCVQVKAMAPFKGGDHFINCAPLGWAGGFPQWYLGCGVTRYFIDMFDGPPENLPVAIWQTIVKEKIMYGFMSPVYVSDILHDTSLWSNSEWKPEVLCLAGQPIKKGHLAIIGKLCSAVDINYGMTECNLVTTHRIRNPESFHDSCAGYPGYGVSLKVVDKDGNELPQGSSGEILLKSPSLTSGYLNSDADSSVFSAEGWFSTNDSGYIDADGKLYVKGRQSDSIMRGAYILYPGWLEQEIKKLDKVNDVVVVAVPDPVLHHEICACIVTDLASEASASGDKKSIPLSNSSSQKSYSFIEKEYEKNLHSSDNHNKSILDKLESSVAESLNSVSNCQLGNVRLKGMNQSLKTGYNETTVKNEVPPTPKVYVTYQGRRPQADSVQNLKMLELELRKFCEGNQALEEKDSMRMVPKYYVFWDRFPVSETGKLNRKEIRNQAAAVLNLL